MITTTLNRILSCNPCERALAASLTTEVCHSCRQAYTVPATEQDKDVSVCPACLSDLTEQVRGCLGLSREAGEGEV